MLGKSLASLGLGEVLIEILERSDWRGRDGRDRVVSALQLCQFATRGASGLGCYGGREEQEPAAA